MSSAEREKVSGYRGVYEETDENGNTVYVPQLKVSGVVQDLGSFPTAQEAALAYDICKLHVACTYNREHEDIKLNNSADMYLNNVAFINLRNNVSMDECTGLIKSGVLLEQFASRYRPVLRTTSHHRTAVPALHPHPHPKREYSPNQQQQQHPPTRTLSQVSEQDRSGGAGGATAQPAAARERGKEPAEPASAPAPARSPSGKATAPAAAAEEEEEEGEEAKKKRKEEEDKKKRKARWVLYPQRLTKDGEVPLHTVWISERTANGNSLSIPAFVKEKVFAGVEDGDLITAINQRSKKEYQWRYRNLRKEGDTGPPKHYLSGSELKTFINETHLQCGDVLQVAPTGPHRAEFIIHRSDTDYVLAFLEYMDNKPPSQPRRAAAAPEDSMAGRGKQQQQQQQQGEAGGGGKKGAAAGAGRGGAREAALLQPQQQQQPRPREAQQGPGQSKPQQAQQQPLSKLKVTPAGGVQQARSGHGSPTSPPPSPFAATTNGIQGGEQGQHAVKPRARPARVWSEFPKGSGQFAVSIAEGMLRTAQMSLPVAVWSAVVGAQQGEHGVIKAVSQADGKSYPVMPHANAEGGGGVLHGLGILFRNHSVGVGDVMAVRPDEPTGEGRAVAKFHIWKEGSEEAAKFRKRLERMRQTKSLPSQPSKAAADIGDTAAAPGSGPLRSSSSSPHQAGLAGQKGGGKRGTEERPAEEPGGEAGDKAARREQQVAAVAPAKRQQVLANSSCSEDEGGSLRQRQQAQALVQAREADPSPKRKASEDSETARAAKRSQSGLRIENSLSPPGFALGMGPGEEGRAQASELRLCQQQQQQPARRRQASGAPDAHAHSSGRGKRPSPEPNDQAARAAPQQQQQQQDEVERARQPGGPAPLAAPALPDLSHLPPKKRMLLMMQHSLAAAPSAGPSSAHSSGAGGRGEVEGAGDSRDVNSVQRRGAAATAAQQPLGRAVAEDVAPPIAVGVSLKTIAYKGDYGGADPSAPDENGLPTPTSPPAMPQGSPEDERLPCDQQQPPHPPSQQQTQTQRQQRREEEAASGRQASPAAHSSGTAGDRPQLRNMASFTVGPTAGGGAAGNGPGGSQAPPLPHRQQQHAQQHQQECSAAVAPAPSGSAAMGSAGQGPELRDAHMLMNDEVAVIQEVMRLVDLTMAAGKVTPELAADLKFGLGALQPIRRWMYYSMFKPLYDVASWDKLVECLKKAVQEAGSA